MYYCLTFFHVGKYKSDVTLEDKVLFWKGHRAYIKEEWNRMRQQAVKGFKDVFFKGALGINILWLLLFKIDNS